MLFISSYEAYIDKNVEVYFLMVQEYESIFVVRKFIETKLRKIYDW